MAMEFIGQAHIMGQLSFLLPRIYADTDESANFLLRAASGQGKTRMAHKICRYIAGKDYQFHLGSIDAFSISYRVHFIDEAHMVKNFEHLYPHLDSGQFVFVIATNEHTHLPEPVENRCYSLTFTDYTDAELVAIINTLAMIAYPDTFLEYLIKSGGRNPRIILSLVKRLNIYFLEEEVPNTIIEFRNLLKILFGITNGLDPIAASYLSILQNLGGIASVATISGIIRIDEHTLKTRIEPLLLANRLIRITKQGRKLWQN